MFFGHRIVGAVFALCLGLAGCAWAADKMPAWMAEPPKDDAQFWYGTGEGSDLDEARRGALRMVASKLGSSIKGAISNDTTVVVSGGKEKVDIKALSTVTEEIENTTFRRFDVAQSAKGGRGVYALVKVDRAAFVADVKRELQAVEKPLRDAEAALPGQSTLDQYLALRRLKNEIDTGTRLSLQLLGAGAQEGADGWARYVGLRQLSNALPSKMSFEMRATQPADADIASALASYLTSQGMRSATTRIPGANVVTVESDTRQDELFGSKMVKLKLRLAVMDDKGRAAATKEYDLPGASRFDFKGAREDAVKKLTEQLRKVGPLAGLGFKE